MASGMCITYRQNPLHHRAMSNGLILGADLRVRVFCCVIDRKREIFATIITAGLTAETRKPRNHVPINPLGAARYRWLFKYCEKCALRDYGPYRSDSFPCKST